MFNKKAISLAVLTASSLTGFNNQVFADSLSLEEIVVTAQRRAESIQDVPIAMIAATQEQLENAGATSFKDIGMIASGVSVGDSNNFIFPFIRGVGSFIQSGSTNSSVAIYMDGVYLPRLSSAALELANVQSVEILKGPQATLYGRNATGGTIKVSTLTTQPGDEFEGNVSVTLGEYGEKRGSFYVAGGISDTLAANLSGYYAERDGFVENLASQNIDVEDGNEVNGKDLDSLNTYYLNTKITWMPSDDLSITLSGFVSESDDTAASAMQQLSPVSAAATMSAIAALQGQTIPASFFTFSDKKYEAYGHSNRTKNSSFGGSVAIDYAINDALELRSLTAANWVDSNASTDLFVSQVAFQGFEGVTNSNDFSQEFQLTAIDGVGIDWMAGVSHFQEESNDYEDLIIIAQGAPLLNSRMEWSVKADSVFGEVYYNFTEQLALTVGVRYTEETFETTPIVGGFIPIANPETEKLDDDALTYRVVLDYTTDWGLVYGSVATGFKSGGRSTANPDADPYDAEELTSYEVGVKSSLLDDRINLNAAAFVYDFTNIQAQVISAGTGASYIVSGDSADVSGLDVEMIARVTEKFSMQAGLTWLIDREYTDFDVPASGPVPALDVTGNKLVGAAETSALLGGQYSQPIDGLGTLNISSSINYSSGYFHTLENNIGTGGLDDDAFVRINARVALVSESETWEVALWANNLTDEYYTRSGLSVLGGASKLGLEGQPRQVGVTAKYSF